MARYTLTNKAILDLSAIWDNTVDSWSERQADKYYFTENLVKTKLK